MKKPYGPVHPGWYWVKDSGSGEIHLVEIIEHATDSKKLRWVGNPNPDSNGFWRGVQRPGDWTRWSGPVHRDPDIERANPPAWVVAARAKAEAAPWLKEVKEFAKSLKGAPTKKEPLAKPAVEEPGETREERRLQNLVGVAALEVYRPDIQGYIATFSGVEPPPESHCIYAVSAADLKAIVLKYIATLRGATKALKVKIRVVPVGEGGVQKP